MVLLQRERCGVLPLEQPPRILAEVTVAAEPRLHESTRPLLQLLFAVTQLPQDHLRADLLHFSLAAPECLASSHYQSPS